MHYVIFITAGWGYTSGGINVFNRQLCEAMAELECKDFKIICIAPRVKEEEISEAKTHKLELVRLDDYETDFDTNIKEVLKKYNISENDKVDWIGHDVYTGFEALKCKPVFPNGRVSVIHHMAYDQYYLFLNTDYKAVEEKKKNQRDIIMKSDFVFANGPVLFESAQDLAENNKEKVHIIYPGITNVKGILKTSPNKFSVVTFGRIEPAKGTKINNSIIKQINLAVAAWASFAEKITDDNKETKMTLFGKNPEDDVDNDLINLVDEHSKSLQAIEILPYQDNREELLDNLKRFSVCLVLSFKEGFGLTALEAISAGVPLIVSQNSGFFKMLKMRNMENFVNGVNIDGLRDFPYYTTEDLEKVKEKLQVIYNNKQEKKNNTLFLLMKLKENNLTWDCCANTILKVLSYSGEKIKEFDMAFAAYEREMKKAIDMDMNQAQNELDNLGEKYSRKDDEKKYKGLIESEQLDEDDLREDIFSLYDICKKIKLQDIDSNLSQEVKAHILDLLVNHHRNTIEPSEIKRFRSVIDLIKGALQNSLVISKDLNNQNVLDEDVGIVYKNLIKTIYNILLDMLSESRSQGFNQTKVLELAKKDSRSNGEMEDDSNE